MKSSPSIVWFRQDLRLADNPALTAAVARGNPIIPAYIWAPEEEVPWPPGGASKWWLHQSLARLSEDLQQAGTKLVIRKGESLLQLLQLARETAADVVFWNRRYEPAIVERDARIKQQLRSSGLEVESFNGSLLTEPWTIQNKTGKPFQVFTPFWRTCLASGEPAKPLPSPRTLDSPLKAPDSVPLTSLQLEPNLNWASAFRDEWQPGSTGAELMLRQFIDRSFSDYTNGRNRPDQQGTSRLSPHLHFGEISPRQLWHAVAQHAETKGLAASQWRSSQFLAEIGWREFAYHLLYHFPHTPEHPLRCDFARFPWRPNPGWLEAWQRGQTGYPIVDAGMRQLWTTGWMHNRVRMIVASFFVKNLLLPWQEGARWFWDTLVDADLANNTLGWQWSAGCGADAAPFFRVFNPVTQGEKFDPKGSYVRRWIPELANVPDEYVHCPWEAKLKLPYTKPLVSLYISRQVALEAYRKLKGSPRPVQTRK